MHTGVLQGKERVATRSDQAATIRSLSDTILVVNCVRPASRVYRVGVIEQVRRCAAGNVEVRQCGEHVLSKWLHGNKTRIRVYLIGTETAIVKVCENLRGLCERLTGFRIDEILERLAVIHRQNPSMGEPPGVTDLDHHVPGQRPGVI